MKLLKTFLGLSSPSPVPNALAEHLRSGILLTGKSLVTGGDAGDRSNLMALAATQAEKTGIQCLVLHRKTSQVPEAVCRRSGREWAFPGYDPLRGKTPEEAALLLSDCAAASGYEGFSIYLLLEDILRVIHRSKEVFSIHTLLKQDARSWHRKLMEDDDHFLDSHVNEKAITELSRFLAQLRLAFPRTADTAVSLTGAASPRLCLDLGENLLTWHLALLEISRLREMDRELCVILEAPPIDQVLLKLTEHNWERGALMLCGPDLTARREEWHALSADLVVMAAYQHESGISCDALAQYFGQCERVKIEQNVGSSRENTALLTRTIVTGAASRTVREYSIPPETIQHLPPEQAVIRIRRCGQAVCSVKKPTGGAAV